MIAKEDAKNHKFATRYSCQSFFLLYKKMISGRNNHLQERREDGMKKMEGWPKKERVGIKKSQEQIKAEEKMGDFFWKPVYFGIVC